mmetsp:Transcript_46518/g.55949  ORF Transcript_46518/g.55949 Transcript_46518/m.55949 type:complete len:235 (+) Transcript_46518:250-954(+)
MAGKTSNFEKSQISDGLNTTERIVLLFSDNFASTDLFASKYLFNHSGANFSSTCGPSDTSGQPASAAETKQIGNFDFPVRELKRDFAIDASIILYMVPRVIASYVLDSPGSDPLPDTILFKSAKPLFTSKRRPIACTTASLSFTIFLQIDGSVASPTTHFTCDKHSSSGLGLVPRRETAVTSNPFLTKRSHTAVPTYPVPPKTATFFTLDDNASEKFAANTAISTPNSFIVERL